MKRVPFASIYSWSLLVLLWPIREPEKFQKKWKKHIKTAKLAYIDPFLTSKFDPMGGRINRFPFFWPFLLTFSKKTIGNRHISTLKFTENIAFGLYLYFFTHSEAFFTCAVLYWVLMSQFDTYKSYNFQKPLRLALICTFLKIPNYFFSCAVLYWILMSQKLKFKIYSKETSPRVYERARIMRIYTGACAHTTKQRKVSIKL